MGRRAITPETATGLGEAFEVDPQFWMNLESTYRLSKVESKAGDVARRAKLYAQAPVQDMIRRHWIDDAEDIDGLEREVLDFFGVGSVEEIASLQINAAARKSTSYEETTRPNGPGSVGHNKSPRTLEVSEYRGDRFQEFLGELRRLTSSEQQAKRVPRLLAEFGIRFMIVEHLPRTRIDGAAALARQAFAGGGPLDPARSDRLLLVYAPPRTRPHLPRTLTGDR